MDAADHTGIIPVSAPKGILPVVDSSSLEAYHDLNLTYGGETMARTVENVNLEILRECREQIGLGIDDVESQVASIALLESGQKPPTFKQLETLSDLYNVPYWVFISDNLPPEYRFSSLPAFRKFSRNETDVFKQHKTRRLVARVEELRDFIIELREDMDEPIPELSLFEWNNNLPIKTLAEKVRTWLEVKPDTHMAFLQWKERLERKNIFVFLTSKYRGWSHIDKDSFRGLSIYHSTLPIIIINDSDAKKAQSFTLFHELGHLIKGETEIDDWSDPDHGKETERWCDRLAGEILMPADQFLSRVSDTINDLESVKDAAKFFQVSYYACLVRLRHLERIEQYKYDNFVGLLKAEYERQRQKQRESSGGPSRDRAREVLNQYGRIYVNTLLQAHHNGEVTLHKLCEALDLKQVSHALRLRDGL